MDEKVRMKKSKIEESSLGTSLEPNKKIEESSLGTSLEPNKLKKEKHKEKKKMDETDKTLNENESVGGNCIDEAGNGKDTEKQEGDIRKKKKKKRRRDTEVVYSNITDDKVVEIVDDNHKSEVKTRKNCNDSLSGVQEMGTSKPSKKEKGKLTRDSYFKDSEVDPPMDGISAGDANADLIVNKVDCLGKEKKKRERSKGMVEGYKGKEAEDNNQGKMMRNKKEKQSDKSICKEKNEFENSGVDQHLAKGNEVEGDDQRKKMKKRKQSDKSKSKENDDVDDQGRKMKKKKRIMSGTGESSNSAPDVISKPKRVSFSDQVEICCDGLIRGKRFTPEEDKIIEEAVFEYIDSHGLGDEGLDKVLHCKSHPDVRNCWKEIAAALPNRPLYSVYSRAHILLNRDEKRKWTAEELEFIKKVQEQHGHDWKSVAEALGRNRFHVKDAWRRIKFTDAKKGPWSQEEYQKLFDLVNLDLRVRALEEERKSKHGMLRENISWESIGTKLATRTSSLCCKKWYEQLTSSMVAQGEWSDTDDYRMVDALFALDACCMEEVDWDNLLEHRSGDVCRKRWEQMVQYIGEHGKKSFAEQVEVLSKRFCPDLVEAREAFDSKPVVC